MSFAVVRMQKMKSHDLKGIQFHNQRERQSKTNDDIDEELSDENFDLVNDENIDYNERVKEIIESQKEGTRKTRKDAVLVNELLVTSDRDFFDRLDPAEEKRFFEESYKLFSKRYGKQNIAYATVHVDEKTPHLHIGVVPMREGRLQGKNVFNRQELFWIQDKFPEHMKEVGFDLERGEKGSTREHIETREFKKQTLEKDIDFLEKGLKGKKNELSALNEEIPIDMKVPAKREFEQIEVQSKKKNILGLSKREIQKKPTGNVIMSEESYKKVMTAAKHNQKLKSGVKNLLQTDLAKENKKMASENAVVFKELKNEMEVNKSLRGENRELRNENSALKEHISDLKYEIGLIYENTKEFLKERTDGLQAFRGVFNGFMDKIKEKLPKSEIKRLHDRSEAKENTFDMKRIKELDKQAKRQKTVGKNKDMDLEL